MQLYYRATQARKQFSPMLDAVEKDGMVAVIERRGFHVVIESRDELDRILSRCFAFNPQVAFSDSGAVSIWLPELGIYGHGPSLEDAEADLVQATLDYVADWQRLLRYAPNHAEKDGYVQRIKLAGNDGVHGLLFGVEDSD
jgi:hypothetical protein